MLKFTMWFKKGLLVALIAAMGMVSLPMINAYALGGTPAAPGQTSSDKLQKAFAREQTIYARLGKLFDNADSRLSRVQDLINRAKAKGKDVSALQAAFDAFRSAVTKSKTTYENAQGLLTSHPGFDASGNVVDAALALQTVKDLRSPLKEILQTVSPAAKGLREAVKTFREANSPNATPAPTQSGG